MLYDVIMVGIGPSDNHLAFKLTCLSYDVLVVDKKAALLTS